MSILSSKWMLGFLILVIIFLILLLVGKKSVSAEVMINNSVENVWLVLTDIENINEWNKVLVPIEGTMTEGSKIKYEFYQEENGKAAVMEAKVIELKNMELINQKGGIPLILTFNHKYIFSENGGQTNVKIYEKYSGAMVPFWNPKPVEKAYERLLQQLKNRVENE